MMKYILQIACFLFLLSPLYSFSQEKAILDSDSAKMEKIDEKPNIKGVPNANRVEIAKQHKHGFLGISNDDWLMILIIVIIIETFWLIIIAKKYKSREKEKNKLTSSLTDCFRVSLYRIPKSIDPNNLPPIPENINDIKEKIELLNEKDYSVIELYLKLGNIEYAKGNIEKALSFYEKVLEQAEKQNYKDIKGICLSNIGQIYLHKGELDTALKCHEDALEIHKKIGYIQDEASHLGNIGLVYLLKEEYDSSIEYFTKAIDLKPDFEKLYYNRGIAYHKIDKKENAQKDFDKAKEFKNANNK